MGGWIHPEKGRKSKAVIPVTCRYKSASESQTVMQGNCLMQAKLTQRNSAGEASCLSSTPGFWPVIQDGVVLIEADDTQVELCVICVGMKLESRGSDQPQWRALWYPTRQTSRS